METSADEEEPFQGVLAKARDSAPSGGHAESKEEAQHANMARRQMIEKKALGAGAKETTFDGSTAESKPNAAAHPGAKASVPPPKMAPPRSLAPLPGRGGPPKGPPSGSAVAKFRAQGTIPPPSSAPGRGRGRGREGGRGGGASAAALWRAQRAAGGSAGSMSAAPKPMGPPPSKGAKAAGSKPSAPPPSVARRSMPPPKDEVDVQSYAPPLHGAKQQLRHAHGPHAHGNEENDEGDLDLDIDVTKFNPTRKAHPAAAAPKKRADGKQFKEDEWLYDSDDSDDDDPSTLITTNASNASAPRAATNGWDGSSANRRDKPMATSYGSLSRPSTTTNSSISTSSGGGINRPGTSSGDDGGFQFANGPKPIGGGGGGGSMAWDRGNGGGDPSGSEGGSTSNYAVGAQSSMDARSEPYSSAQARSDGVSGGGGTQSSPRRWVEGGPGQRDKVPMSRFISHQHHSQHARGDQLDDEQWENDSSYFNRGRDAHSGGGGGGRQGVHGGREAGGRGMYEEDERRMNQFLQGRQDGRRFIHGDGVNGIDRPGGPPQRRLGHVDPSPHMQGSGPSSSSSSARGRKPPPPSYPAPMLEEPAPADGNWGGSRAPPGGEGITGHMLDDGIDDVEILEDHRPTTNKGGTGGINGGNGNSAPIAFNASDGRSGSGDRNHRPPSAVDLGLNLNESDDETFDGGRARQYHSRGEDHPSGGPGSRMGMGYGRSAQGRNHDGDRHGPPPGRGNSGWDSNADSEAHGRDGDDQSPYDDRYTDDRGGGRDANQDGNDYVTPNKHNKPQPQLAGLQKPQKKKREPTLVFDPRRVPYVRRDLRDFVNAAPPDGPGPFVRCYIERKKGMTKVAPVYYLRLELQGQPARLMMCAQKKVSSKTPHYVISMDSDDLTAPRQFRGDWYLGKLRGNLEKTEYQIFDAGHNPRDMATEEESRAPAEGLTRLELGAIVYNFKKARSAKHEVRKMEVGVPRLNEDDSRPAVWRSTFHPDDSLLSDFNRSRYQGAQNVHRQERLSCLHVRVSRYDALSSCLIDFKSRATQKSVKNFQLIDSFPENKQLQSDYLKQGGYVHVEDPEGVPPRIVLQLGKIGKDKFNMDYQYPLSMLQAFAICLSRFDCNGGPK